MARRQGHRPTRGGGRDRSGANTVPVTDSRFARISTDPRFRLPSKRHTHVAIDQRFSRMLRDDEFSQKASVDRYGRKIAKGSGRRELKRFYNLEEEEEEGENGRSEGEEDQDGDTEDEDEDAVERKLAKAKRPYDPARDGGFSASDDDTSSDEEEEDDNGEENVFGEDDHQYPDMQVDETTDVPMGEISSRIAVVNLDWDNIRAVDLMAVFSSFCPPDGRLQHVAIYPSEFGKERLAREETEGPPREIFADRETEDPEGGSSEDEEEEADDDEKIKKSLLKEDKGEEFDNTKLRRYQLERLRYYYAVLTLSSPEAAKALYDATDGTEYLTTANFFDLRFVPDNVPFEGDRVRDECSSIPDDYKPNNFVTDALQHSKVKLTWDAEDNVRKEMVKKAFSGSRRDIEENDLKAYLGSDSSGDEDGDDDVVPGLPGQADKETKASKKEQERQRLRAALGLESVSVPSGAKKTDAPVGDMQITFTSGLSGPAHLASTAPAEETTIEKYKRKEKERKQKRHEKAAAARDSGNKDVPGGAAHEDSPAADQDDDEENEEDLGFDDPFFTSVAPDDEDHIPSKSSKNTTSRKTERQRRRQEAEEKEAQSSRERAELELLMLDDEKIPSSAHHKSSNSESPTTKEGEGEEQGQGKFSHFDINEIARAEKKANKKGRNKKKKALSVGLDNPREHERGGKKQNRHKVDDDNNQEQAHGQGEFKVNTQDPRFQAIFHQPEYAIDPTNPRYRNTEAMRTLLEEGRKKRRRDYDDDDEDGEDIGIMGVGKTRKERKGDGREGKQKRTRIATDTAADGDERDSAAVVSGNGKKNKKKSNDDMDDLRKLAEKVKRKSVVAVANAAGVSKA
ncbi:MAG: Sister chromatid cohesion protein 2 [Watsoniomyces obsoletus]|nr:MAG: Sister chromatid cohesion protein 2 [Watsoniomyces obsoletus]